MKMRLRGENEYSIAITRDEAKKSCMRVTECTKISAPNQACWLCSSTLSSTATVKQSSSDTSTSYFDRANHNFLSGITNTLQGMFAAMKEVVQASWLSAIGSYRVTQGYVVFRSHVFHLQIVN